MNRYHVEKWDWDGFTPKPPDSIKNLIMAIGEAVEESKALMDKKTKKEWLAWAKRLTTTNCPSLFYSAALFLATECKSLDQQKSWLDSVTKNHVSRET